MAVQWVDAVVFLLSGICHQLPDRCFLIDGQPLPLCARCMGTFMGMTVGLMIPWLVGEGRATRAPKGFVLGMMGVSFGAWFVDGVNSFAKLWLGRAWLYEPSNTGRLVTGTALGLAVGAILYTIFQYALWGESDSRRLFQRVRKAAYVPLAGILIIAVAYLGSGLPYVLWVAVLGAMALIPLAVANAALIVLLRGREGVALRGSQYVGYLIMGTACALFEIGGMGYLRSVLIGA